MLCLEICPNVIVESHKFVDPPAVLTPCPIWIDDAAVWPGPSIKDDQMLTAAVIASLGTDWAPGD
jgi:hypothetical protein